MKSGKRQKELNT